MSLNNWKMIAEKLHFPMTFSLPSMSCLLKLPIREFKNYDATVAKTSLKIASSSFSIYFAIMSVCLTFESARNYPGTEFRGAVSTLEKNIQICAWVLTCFVKLEKWWFHVADLPRTWKKCTELKKAREWRAKLLLLSIKYANFVASSLQSRRWS